MVPGKMSDIGLCLAPTRDALVVAAQAAAAEQAGFTHVWVTDTQGLWRDAYVCLALMADRTSTVKLGPMVTNVTTRHPTVTASAMATLAEASGGRAVLGIGTGRSSVRLLGEREAPLAKLRQDVQGIRALFRGESIAVGDASFALDPGLAPADIPIYLSASGPRMLRLAGEVGDGVIFVVGATPGLAAYAHEQIDRGAAHRQGDLALPYRLHYVQCALGASREEAIELGRAMAGFQLAQLTVPKTAYSSEQYSGGDYDYREHYSSDNLVRETVTAGQTQELVACGDVEHLTSRLVELAQTGIDQLTLYPCGDMDDFIRACATSILPALRRATSP